MGISAKDLSHGDIKDVALENCEYGFAIFQKKPEFGPATTVAKQVTFDGVKNEFVLDKDSKIELNGKESVGKKKIDIDALFY